VLVRAGQATGCTVLASERVCKSKAPPAAIFFSLLQFNGAIENVAAFMLYVIYVRTLVAFGQDTAYLSQV